MIHVFDLNEPVNSTTNILVLVLQTWIFEGLQKGVGFPLRPLFKNYLFVQIGTESILTCVCLVLTHKIYKKQFEITIFPLNIHHHIINIIQKTTKIFTTYENHKFNENYINVKVLFVV